MRVTGGELGGRVLKAPAGGVRPTQDLVRGSLFSMLGERIVGARFLDLYAGTGAVGIDAWSRGAAQVCWVEANGAALRQLEQNVRTLCGEAGRIVRGEVLKVLRRGLFGAPYDVIFADPPYAKERHVGSPEGRNDDGLGRRRRQRHDGGGGEWDRLLAAVETGGLLADGGWLIVEQGADEPPVVRNGWDCIKDKRYGGTQLRVLVRRQEPVEAPGGTPADGQTESPTGVSGA